MQDQIIHDLEQRIVTLVEIMWNYIDRLLDAGQHIAAIQVLRDGTGVSLKAAKTAVEDRIEARSKKG